MKTILASASPRRRELLEQMGITFEVRPAKGEEVITKTVPEEVVQELAYQKAYEVAQAILHEVGEKKEQSQETVRVIGSDTVVVYQGAICGKPADQTDASRMLHMLQGNTHQVYTGVCVIDLFAQDETAASNEAVPLKEEAASNEKVSFHIDEMKIHVFAEKTDVTMYPISEKEIQEYIETGECMDKAGAYAIQGISAKFIQEIKGDYYNVVGLPMARLYQECYKVQ